MTDDMTDSSDDPRGRAFLSPGALDVFHSVEHRQEIWKADPFDVPGIHTGAREAFETMLARATTPPGLQAGRILLLLGEAGSGKTHLMRSFRERAHAGGKAYFGYMQMTSSAEDYGAYVLSNLIDSLEKPFAEGRRSGLRRLSDALAVAAESADALGALSQGLASLAKTVARAHGEKIDSAAHSRANPAQASVGHMLRSLRRDDLTQEQIDDVVFELGDRLVCDERLRDVDVEVLRALLYLQRDDPRIKPRVLRFLRCEDMAERDRRYVGGLVPRTRGDDAQRMAELLGRLMWALGVHRQTCLVLAVDQLEDIYNLDDAGTKFRRAMASLCALADRIPSSVIVVACLEDYYEALKPSLTRPLLDRIEHDPAPIRLESQRSPEEVRALVARRLRVLYQRQGVAFDPAQACYPFRAGSLDQLSYQTTRTVLQWCQEQQAKAIALGALPADEEQAPAEQAQVAEVAASPSPSITIQVEQTWNDYRVAQAAAPPDDEEELAGLLAWAIEACSREVTGVRFQAVTRGRFVDADVLSADDAVSEALVVGLCERSPRGGALGKQVIELLASCAERVPVVARSTEFPDDPRTKVSRQLGQLVSQGGRRVLIEDADWRTIIALRAFERDRGADPDFAHWLRDVRPLSHLASLAEILDLDALRVRAAEPAPAAEASVSAA
jgi:AAA ATPase domain